MKYLIKKIVVGELQTNCYIIINEQKEAIIIDPGEEFEKIMANCKEYKLVNVLITHHHFDHVGALNEIKKELEKLVNCEWLCSDGVITIEAFELNTYSCVPPIPDNFDCLEIVWD